MSHVETLPNPEHLARKLFVLVMIGIVVFVTAVVLINRYVPSGDEAVTPIPHVALR